MHHVVNYHDEASATLLRKPTGKLCSDQYSWGAVLTRTKLSRTREGNSILAAAHGYKRASTRSYGPARLWLLKKCFTLTYTTQL